MKTEQNNIYLDNNSIGVLICGVSKSTTIFCSEIEGDRTKISVLLFVFYHCRKLLQNQPFFVRFIPLICKKRK